MKSKPVYRYKSGKGYKFSQRWMKNAVVAGEFIFLQHPDDCPEGEWSYYAGNGKQPTYNWTLTNQPR